MRACLLAACLALLGCTHQGLPPMAAPGVTGPRHTTVDLFRVAEGTEQLYLEADLGDGTPRLFLLDTGASISVVSWEVAQALRLPVTGELVLGGIGGQARVTRALVPHMRIGRFDIQQVDVAIGLPGIPEAAGLVPLAGVLGSNVLSRFAVAIDYNASTLDLARPGELFVPDSAVPLTLEAGHAVAEVTLLVATEGEPLRHTEPLIVDTGAHRILLSGSLDADLLPLSKGGEEPLIGAGSPLDLPTSAYMDQTRRLSLSGLEAGGQTVSREMEATWTERDISLLGTPALAGNRVVLDFPGRRFALEPSQARLQFKDVHLQTWKRLEHEHDPDTLLFRAQLLWVMDRVDEAEHAVEARVRKAPEDYEAQVTLVRIKRFSGETDEALALARRLPAGVLAMEHEIIATVNSLWLSGDVPAALELGRQAVAEEPEVPDAWVALADALRASGDSTGARQALTRANQLTEDPDGFLLRRAWISSNEGDTYAALTHVRRLVQRTPQYGQATWFYAQVVDGTENEPMLRADVDQVVQRLHPTDSPLDFLAAAYHSLGEDALARGLMEQGLIRDCESMAESATKENCTAWYMAMAGTDIDVARAKIDEAVKSEPDKPQFLDTMAVVYEAQGDLEHARDAAWRAATLVPDDVYLLWQAARISQELQERAGG